MLSIEKVTIDDAEALLAIYAPYVTDTTITFEYDVPSPEEFRNRIVTISSVYPYIKAVKDGEIVGYAYAGTFKGRKAYSWSVETTIYVRQDCHKCGIGRALYTQLEKSLKEMGIQNMNACIACTANDASAHFHKAMGFREVGIFHNIGFKLGQWVDMVWMEKMIGPHDGEPEKLKTWDL